MELMVEWRVVDRWMGREYYEEEQDTWLWMGGIRRVRWAVSAFRGEREREEG